MRVLGAHSLLEAALAHARRFAEPERVWIVCTAENAAAIRAASGLPRARILIEPHGRNTAMAVGFAAARVAAPTPTPCCRASADNDSDARAFATAATRGASARPVRS
jgi:mannose-1-phosphate guanylyltransferase